VTCDVTGDVSGSSGSCTGNSASATTATNATNVALTNEASDTTCFPIFVDTATGNQDAKTNTSLTFGASNATLSATTFSGALSGNASTASTATTVSDNAITLAKMAGGTDGNLITYDTNGDPAAVATGTATHVLTSNGVDTAPTFQAVSAGGATAETVSATITSSWTTTNSALTDVTGMTLTKPDITDGKCMSDFCCVVKNSLSLATKTLVLVDDDVVITGGEVEQHTNTAKGLMSGGAASDADGNTLKLQAAAGGGGTLEVNYQSGWNIPLLSCLGVG